jgi:hypothetical protein
MGEGGQSIKNQASIITKAAVATTMVSICLCTVSANGGWMVRINQQRSCKCNGSKIDLYQRIEIAVTDLPSASPPPPLRVNPRFGKNPWHCHANYDETAERNTSKIRGQSRKENPNQEILRKQCFSLESNESVKFAKHRLYVALSPPNFRCMDKQCRTNIQAN